MQTYGGPFDIEETRHRLVIVFRARELRMKVSQSLFGTPRDVSDSLHVPSIFGLSTDR